MCSKIENDVHLINQMYRKQLHTIIQSMNSIRKEIRSDNNSELKLKTINQTILDNDEKIEEVTMYWLSQ